jgi:hypothetical protein
LFYVAAIGGKSPRALQLCLELYDVVVAESSGRFVAKLSRICVIALRAAADIQNPEWERMPLKQLIDFADRTDHGTMAVIQAEKRTDLEWLHSRSVHQYRYPLHLTATISDVAPASISRFGGIRSTSGFLMPVRASSRSQQHQAGGLPRFVRRCLTRWSLGRLVSAA